MTERDEPMTDSLEDRFITIWEPDTSRPFCGSRERIVVGVDDSETSRAALRWAAEEAMLRRTHLHVVHFIESGDRYDAGFLPSFIVATFENGTVPVNIESATICSTAAQALVATSHNAALLVLGAAQRERFWEIFASVPKRVASFASCPVVVVQEGHDDRKHRHNRVVTVFDESFTARDAFEWAVEEAVYRSWAKWLTPQQGCQLSILWQTPRTGKWIAKREKVEELITQERAERLMDLQVTVERPTMQPLSIVQASQAADLIVIGAASRVVYKNLMDVLEGNSAALGCPIVIVPESADDRNHGVSRALVDIEQSWATGLGLDVWFAGSGKPVHAEPGSGSLNDRFLSETEVSDT